MGINVTRRVSYRGGWFGLLSGESQGKAIDRELVRLNSDGYRVAFIVPDKWNIFLRLIWLLVTILTLGIYSNQPNLLVIGERIDGVAVKTDTGGKQFGSTRIS